MEERRTLSTYLQDPLALLWRIWASRQASLVLLGLSGLALALILALPQAPPSIANDPRAYGRWLAGLRNQYGAALDLLRSLGLLDVRGSWGLRLLLAALAFHLLIRIGDSLACIQIALQWDTPEGARPWREWAIPLASWEGLEERLESYLGRQRFRLRQEGNGGDTPRLIAMRFPRTLALSLALPVGALLILVGLLLDERYGWQERDLLLGEGQSVAIEHGTGLTLVGEAFAVTPPDWRSQVALVREGQTVRAAELRPAKPLLFANLLFVQSGLAPSATLAVHDAQGQVVEAHAFGAREEREETTVHLRERGDEGYFSVPSQNLAFRLRYEGAADLRVQIFRGGQSIPIRDELLSGEATWNISDVTYRLTRGYKALLQITFAPGVPWMLLGLLLMGAGGVFFSGPADDDKVHLVAREDRRRVIIHLYAPDDVQKPPTLLADLASEIERLLTASKEEIGAFRSA